jgi:NAD(P)-dependent dehydrogenase (short-subunit alcohol dehydrogenase family)
MKTILITGGASGIGKGLAMHYLKEGNRVIAIGSSAANGDALNNDAKQIGAGDRAVYIQANLSLIAENQRITEEIKTRFPALDVVIFCAAKHSKEYTETTEGLEFTFALDYLSRFVLSYSLKENLEKSDSPIIMNVCGTGMKGDVNWSDLQHKAGFAPQKVMMHGSRLNNLSGVAFAQNDTVGKIKYILYNPMAVQTPGMMEYSGLLMKLIYKAIGKPVDKAVVPIIELLDNPPASSISAFRERTPLDLSLATYNTENAKRLYSETMQVLAGSISA